MAGNVFTEIFHLGFTAEHLEFFTLRFWVFLQRIYGAQVKLWKISDKVWELQDLGIGSSDEIPGCKGRWRCFDRQLG